MVVGCQGPCDAVARVLLIVELFVVIVVTLVVGSNRVSLSKPLGITPFSFGAIAW